MSLSPDEQSYLNHELNRVTRVLIDEYDAEKNRIGPSEPVGFTDQIEARRLRRLARDLGRTRATKFIEIFRKLRKFPDEDYYRSFDEITRKLLVERILEIFDESSAHPFSNPSPQPVAEALRRTFSQELQSIHAEEIRPVTSLFLEGRARRSVPLTKTRTVMDLCNSFLQELYERAGGRAFQPVPTPEIQSAMGLDNNELGTVIARLTTAGLAIFSFGESTLTAEGRAAVETNRLSVTEIKGNPTTNITIHGDIVGGDQLNSRDVTTNNVNVATGDQGKWSSWLTAIGVVVAIVSVIVAVSIPESRNYVCSKTGFLCSKSP